MGKHLRQPCNDLDPQGQLASRIKNGLKQGVFPAAVLLVAIGRQVIFHRAFGVTDTASGKRVDCETVFDLASLTKPLATSLAVMALIKEGLVELDQEIGCFLTHLEHTSKAGITVRHLLSHRSGLPAYRPYFQTLRLIAPEIRKNALRHMLARETLESAPGTTTCYSDLGFMLLCQLVETVSGQRLDHYLASKVYKPLDLEKELFFVDLEGPLPKRMFAATERCPWRGRVLKGQVHDDNAYVVGGIEGHAGLFGTAWAIWELLDAMVTSFRDQKGWGPFDHELVAEFITRQPGGRSLGFDRVSADASSTGRFFSQATIGHLGFTGTSFWIDLEKEVTVVLLTNRVHPNRENDKILLFRPQLHDTVMELVTIFER